MVKPMSSRSYFAKSPRLQTPGTIGLLVASVVGYLLVWVPQSGDWMVPNLAFHYDLARFWQLLTYPFIDYGVGIALIFYMFSLMWLFNFGSAFERSFGTRSLLAHFFGSAILFGLFAFVAVQFFPSMHAYLYRMWLPVSFITVTLCGRNPPGQMSYWGIPMSYKVLAALTGVLIVITYGVGSPFFGLILALPLILAYFYGAGQLGVFAPGKNIFAKRTQEKVKSREFDEFRGKVLNREKERAERERLRQLFEGSLDEEPPGAER